MKSPTADNSLSAASNKKRLVIIVVVVVFVVFHSVCCCFYRNTMPQGRKFVGSQSWNQRWALWKRSSGQTSSSSATTKTSMEAATNETIGTRRRNFAILGPSVDCLYSSRSLYQRECGSRHCGTRGDCGVGEHSTFLETHCPTYSRC